MKRKQTVEVDKRYLEALEKRYHHGPANRLSRHDFKETGELIEDHGFMVIDPDGEDFK